MKTIVSKNIRLRHPDKFSIGDYSIVDDFCYFSTRVKIGFCTHIASGCNIAGGPKHSFEIGDFSSLSSGVKIWCSSNDFVNDLVMIIPPGIEIEGMNPIEGDVLLANYTGIGANSVVMPDNHIPEGTVIGALSYVPTAFQFESWSVYAGIPIRKIGNRNRKNVVSQIKQIRNNLKNK